MPEGSEKKRRPRWTAFDGAIELSIAHGYGRAIMINALARLYFAVFAPRHWEPVALVNGQWAMRRWINGAWECRPCTAEEARDAHDNWAIR